MSQDEQEEFSLCETYFANELKQVGVNEQVASELLGHASQSITYGRYGKESRIEVLLKQISKIFFLNDN